MDPFRFTSKENKDIIEEAIAQESIKGWPEPITMSGTIGIVSGGSYMVEAKDLSFYKMVKAPCTHIPKLSNKTIKTLAHGIMVKKGMRNRFNLEIDKLLRDKTRSNNQA